MRAMILAAGLGTRLRPLTGSLPKAMVEIDGKPLIQIVIERLKQAGFREIIINLHHFPEKIMGFLNENQFFGLPIRDSAEEELLDTGGGIKKAIQSFGLSDQPLLVHNVDILCNFDLSSIYKFAVNSDYDAVVAVNSRQTSRYLLFDENNLLAGWLNKKTGERIEVEGKSAVKEMAYSGIQLIKPSVFKKFPPENKFSIIDFYLNAAQEIKIMGLEMKNQVWFDIGKSVNDIKEAEKILRLINSTKIM
ncbi:MAG: nucleotidyltransferase family protein [Ignavibacteriales bacterium]|nr:nucleotidyltransferase family protein [Ignavibacteriales bacterium]MCF8305862.1 nucleotidyltransferase family protein [Ignavibacteriales bacterium]MCF8315584.1 nucleotidyltransferase family protein [Ignavibacteriales bacterium]MCF8436886.1 nucleotidyltransferase family protein [Ignavibacteriales bacterium]